VRIPFADSHGLGTGARRAWLIRLFLAAALGTLLLGAFVAVPGESARAVTRTGRTVVVLDLSGSIEGNDFPAVGRALERAAREAGSSGTGLVLFSDSAEEALPPGTPTRELLRFRRFFSSRSGPGQPESNGTILYRPGRKASTLLPPPPTGDLNPWQPHFSGGTAISSGIAVARAALGEKGQMILISDFVDSTWDAKALRKQLLAIARTPGLELEPILLPAVLPGAANPYLHLMERTLPAVSKASAPAGRSETSTFPGWLLVLGGLLATALAANELLAVSLRFREARA